MSTKKRPRPLTDLIVEVLTGAGILLGFGLVTAGFLYHEERLIGFGGNIMIGVPLLRVQFVKLLHRKDDEE